MTLVWIAVIKAAILELFHQRAKRRALRRGA